MTAASQKDIAGSVGLASEVVRKHDPFMDIVVTYGWTRIVAGRDRYKSRARKAPHPRNHCEQL